MVEYQPSLLSHQDWKAAEVSWAYQQTTPTEELTGQEIQAWKQRIFQFQREVAAGAYSAQGSLFAQAPTPADSIDPYTLPQKNAEFWRGQFSDTGSAALYFVVDHQLPLLLYVGETVKANQRWKGVHDCKHYILSYISAHRSQDLAVQVSIGFWPHAPADRKARQALETELIQKWRSPFNKENWRRWATPFVSGSSL